MPHRGKRYGPLATGSNIRRGSRGCGLAHEHPWREALPGFGEPAGFTTVFYQAYVAGKRRLEGARAALERLGGSEGAGRAAEYAAVKQALIDRLIDEGNFDLFPDAVRFAAAMHGAGLKLALASSSRNAAAMLRQVNLPDGRALLSLFDADLSGCEVPRGKPDPALFLLAAEALSVAPARCLVVEDAPAGVHAARSAGMTALGIARLGDEALLRDAGADLVVTSLDRIDMTALVGRTLSVLRITEDARDAGGHGNAPARR